MFVRFLAAATFALLLAATPGAAQTVAEQMQKAIYQQETVGDLDAAIGIYRQILSSAPADRSQAAQAQYRLAQALLQKGDLDEAAREFQALANHSEYKDMIAALAGRVRSASRGSTISRGTYTITTGTDGHYVNRATGVELTVPVGCTIVDAGTSDSGDTARLTDPSEKSVSVWMISESHAAGELAALLRHDLEIKPSMRNPDWKVRPESIQMGVGGERQSLKAVADFTENGTKMVEQLLWVRTPRTHVLFFGRAPAAAQGTLPDSFARIVATAVIP
jgi:hypothetical protein